MAKKKEIQQLQRSKGKCKIIQFHLTNEKGWDIVRNLPPAVFTAIKINAPKICWHYV